MGAEALCAFLSERVTESQIDLRGTAIALDAVCTDGEQKVDVTGGLVLFVCGLVLFVCGLALFVCGAPILVGVLLVLPAFFTPDKKQKEAADSEK